MDHELIVGYLRRKIRNEPMEVDGISEVNLYQHEPYTLAAIYPQLGENEWYFFTSRDRKYPNGTRPSRSAGSGYWKATGSDKAIFSGRRRVGFKKALVFYEGKPPRGEKTDWIMHEFRVDQLPASKRFANDMRLDDWVLCRIYKKAEKAGKNQQDDEDCAEAIEQVAPNNGSLEQVTPNNGFGSLEQVTPKNESPLLEQITPKNESFAGEVAMNGIQDNHHEADSDNNYIFISKSLADSNYFIVNRSLTDSNYSLDQNAHISDVSQGYLGYPQGDFHEDFLGYQHVLPRYFQENISFDFDWNVHPQDFSFPKNENSSSDADSRTNNPQDN